MTEPSEHEPWCERAARRATYGCICALAERQEIHRLRAEATRLRAELQDALAGQRYWRGRFVELNGEAED